MSNSVLRSFVVAIALLAVGCPRASAPSCSATGAGLACVDNEAIAAADVTPLVRPPPIPIDAPRIDHLDRAVNEAIRARLFAREARKRGLAGQTDGELSQALITKEVGAQGAARDAISDADARSYYDAHPSEFLHVESVQARGIAVATLEEASRLAAEARGVDDAKFAELAKKHSLDESKESGGELGKVDDHSTRDDAIVRAALALHSAGQTAGPFVDGKGRWWILRAVAVEAAARPFDAISVKNGLAKLRRDEKIAALEAELRGRAKIEVNAAGVAALAPPK